LHRHPWNGIILIEAAIKDRKMLFISAVIDLFTQPQGGFTYHLLLLLIIEAALAMALIQWRRNGQGRALAVPVALASLLLIRSILVGMEVLERLGVLPSIPMLIMGPAVERLFIIVGAGFLCWTFLLPSPKSLRVPDMLFGINSVAALQSHSVLIPSWQGRVDTRPVHTTYLLRHPR
jgi:hypothetical protein